MISVFSFALAVLASARLTRLATKDSITEPLRVRIVAKANKEWVETLFSCPWCIGFWISAIVIGITWYYHPGWLMCTEAIFAGSFLVGLLSRGDA